MGGHRCPDSQRLQAGDGNLIYLHRALPVFFLPVGITLFLVLAGLWMRRRALIWAGLALLWLSSTPLVSALVIRAVEGSAERIPATNAPGADAIVVLSGGRIVAPGKAAISEWEDPDRFFGGVELFKAGKAPLLVFTNGLVPGRPQAEPEGEVLAGYAKEMGVPAGGILTTGRVTNTAEEALAVATLLRGRLSAPADRATAPRVLLVTSAYHMARARRLFEGAGMTVVPFPVDFQVSAHRAFSVLDFLPTAEALRLTELAWREVYGRLFYFVFR